MNIFVLLCVVSRDRDHQTLLYSATIPDWVKSIAQRFLKPTHKVVDLVGREKVQTSQTVRHLALEVPASERTEAVSDLIKVYGVGKSCIIFCDTKQEANAIALSSSLASQCQVLHGDIAQAQREVTLASFREGKFPCLVATNVAARGLDIAGVELIIQVLFTSTTQPHT
jgi:ATP-dependent RNA helicase DDX21